MRAIFSMRRVALISVLTPALLVAGCSKGSSPTGPPATSNSFDSGSLVAPTTFDHVFPTAGTVDYHCNYHRSVGMVGQVVVDGSGAAAVTDTASGTSFHPLVVTVRPGGTVHWIILNGTHTVTSDDIMSVGGGGGGYGAYGNSRMR
jgi:plastocyanin